MALEKSPTVPAPERPTGGKQYKVKTGDDWRSVARSINMDVWDLIYFNFKTRDPKVVNYYLRTRVGCTKTTRDGNNYMFSSTDSPGIIYLPQVPTPTNLWFGFAIKGGGHALVAGMDRLEGWGYSADNRENKFRMSITGQRRGPGLGGGGSPVFFIATSVKHPSELHGMQTSTFDFNISLGTKWGTLFKIFRRSKAYRRLLPIIERIGKSRIGRNASRISPSEWEELVDDVKQVVAALEIDPNSPKPQLTLLDLPGPGTELSFYRHNGTVRISDVSYTPPSLQGVPAGH